MAILPGKALFFIGFKFCVSFLLLGWIFAYLRLVWRYIICWRGSSNVLFSWKEVKFLNLQPIKFCFGIPGLKLSGCAAHYALGDLIIFERNIFSPDLNFRGVNFIHRINVWKIVSWSSRLRYVWLFIGVIRLLEVTPKRIKFLIFYSYRCVLRWTSLLSICQIFSIVVFYLSQSF